MGSLFSSRPANTARAFNHTVYWRTCVCLLGAWLCAYVSLEPAANWLISDAAGLDIHSGTGAALAFFLYDSAKILLLLALLVYVIGWLRAGLNTERIRTILSGKRRLAGYALGVLFGAVTPFCSCSSVPLAVAFAGARIPFGITCAFLITSPMINEVAVVLLWGLLGVKLTVIYVALGLLAGMLGGIVMDALHAERWLQPFLLTPEKNLFTLHRTSRFSIEERHNFAAAETRQIVGRVWRWVFIGVGIGALLHGYVPREWIETWLGQGAWWNVPLAVGLGIPLYTSVTGIVPILESLLMKGLPAGTALAFGMSAVAVSLPEFVMLKQIMRPRLLALLAGILLVFFTCAGWILNLGAAARG